MSDAVAHSFITIADSAAAVAMAATGHAIVQPQGDQQAGRLAACPDEPSDGLYRMLGTAPPDSQRARR
jgi:hypothetical protein